MDEKVSLLYDVELLKNDRNKDIGRTGIFFVGHNILCHLFKSDVMDIYIYCQPEDKEYFASYISSKFGLDYSDKILTKADDLSDIKVFLSPIFTKPQVLSLYPDITCYTIIYDLIPMLFPHHYPTNMPGWLHEVIQNMNKNDFYFAISQHTKRDFIKYVPNVDVDKITVVRLATASEFSPNRDQAMLEKLKDKYNIPQNKKYLFSLCSLEPRKNLTRAVQAFIEFVEKNAIEDLVYVLGGGAWDGFIEQFEQLVPNYQLYKDKIIRAGYIADEDLPSLYSNAEWFVYTSEYEGFGMPPLEAMQFGCPVVVSNNSSLPEVVGDAGLMIDFDSMEQHIAAYESYYFDRKLAETNSAKGFLQAQKFSWQECVATMVNKILEVENKKLNTPLVTIVTIAYNIVKSGRQEQIKQCLESVHKQIYTNYEHIIIDGASTDGTLELLKGYEEQGWIKVYSEPDKGIYDAMNKGIAKANGKYINFLNSDDYFHDQRAIEISIQYLEKCSADYSFADTNMLYENGKVVVWTADISKLMIGIHYCHQSMFVKTSALRAIGGFDLFYQVSADSDLMIRLYAQGFKYAHVPSCIVTYRIGGLSGQNQIQSRIEHAKAFSKHIGSKIGLTLYDCMLVWQFKFFDEVSINRQLKLISKVPQEFSSEFLIEEFTRRSNVSKSSFGAGTTCKKAYYLFSFIPVMTHRWRNNKRYYYLFNFLRLIKIVEYNQKKKYYLFGFIPVWKIKQR